MNDDLNNFINSLENEFGKDDDDNNIINIKIDIELMGKFATIAILANDLADIAIEEIVANQLAPNAEGIDLDGIHINIYVTNFIELSKLIIKNKYDTDLANYFMKKYYKYASK